MILKINIFVDLTTIIGLSLLGIVGLLIFIASAYQDIKAWLKRRKNQTL